MIPQGHMGVGYLLTPYKLCILLTLVHNDIIGGHVNKKAHHYNIYKLKLKLV